MFNFQKSLNLKNIIFTVAILFPLISFSQTDKIGISKAHIINSINSIKTLRVQKIQSILNYLGANLQWVLIQNESSLLNFSSRAVWAYCFISLNVRMHIIANVRMILIKIHPIWIKRHLFVHAIVTKIKVTLI